MPRGALRGRGGRSCGKQGCSERRLGGLKGVGRRVADRGTAQGRVAVREVGMEEHGGRFAGRRDGVPALDSDSRAAGVCRRA